MSMNCYHQSNEDAGVQNVRLTSKHIQTLTILQELSRENQKLKAHVHEVELEKDCTRCSELSSIVKDAKGNIQKIQEDCNRRIDQHNKDLAAKHKQEVMQLISNKLEAENDWLQERDKLQQLIADQEEKIKKLTEQLEQLKKYDGKINVIHQQLDKTIAEILELKKDNESLRTDNSHLECQVTGFRADAEKLPEYERMNEELMLQLKEHQQKMKEQAFQVSHLKTELDSVKEKSFVHTSAQDNLRVHISNLSQDLKEKEKKLNKYGGLLHELRGQLKERTEQAEYELGQKDKLILVIQRLEDELHARKEELNCRQVLVKKEESPSFRDYVKMKREINLLRDENETLRLTNRKPRALPCLRVPCGDGNQLQTLTVKSTFSNKWNKQ